MSQRDSSEDPDPRPARVAVNGDEPRPVPWGARLSVVLQDRVGRRWPIGLRARWTHCGGRGRCRACRVRLAGEGGGASTPSAHEREGLSAAELAEGWRLACQTLVHGPLEVETA